MAYFHPMDFLHHSLVAQGHWAGGARICHHCLYLQVITSESRGGVSAECRDPPSCVTLEAEAVTVPGMASSLHTEH